MDITYIKMCDCPEIQGEVISYPINRVFYSEEEGYRFWVDGDYNLWCVDKGDYIWLPRQDDLQKMVADTIDCPSHSSCAIFINVGHRMHQWCDEAWDYWMRFTSMEQLWLAFVMKEKYNKVWNGEEWNV